MVGSLRQSRCKDDWWLTDGFSRYSEAMYVENAAGAAGLEEAVKDMSVGALAYDTVPLSSASKLDIFSTEFQSLATDKGAMILHMLRWVLGEDKYLQDHARIRRASSPGSRPAWTISRPSPRKITATSSPGSSPSGSTPPAPLSSK